MLDFEGQSREQQKIVAYPVSINNQRNYMIIQLSNTTYDLENK